MHSFAVAKQEVADESVATIHSEDASLGDKAFARVALAVVAICPLQCWLHHQLQPLVKVKSTINNKIDSGGTAIVEILMKFGSSCGGNHVHVSCNLHHHY